MTNLELFKLACGAAQRASRMVVYFAFYQPALNAPQRQTLKKTIQLTENALKQMKDLLARSEGGTIR